MKPVVPPRPRGISGIDYKRNGIPNAATTNGKSPKTNFNEDVPCKDNDIANADCKFNSLGIFPPFKILYSFLNFLLPFSEFTIDIEYNFTIDGHNKFRNAIAPKTQKYRRIAEWNDR